MKKFFASILILLYFASTSGATVYMHYCMGRLVDVTLQQSAKQTCSKCGMVKNPQSNKDCCKDKQQQVKIEKEHQKTETVFQPLVPIAPVTAYTEGPAVSIYSITEENPTSNAPPRSSGPALFKRNCVFRI